MGDWGANTLISPGGGNPSPGAWEVWRNEARPLQDEGDRVLSDAGPGAWAAESTGGRKMRGGWAPGNVGVLDWSLGPEGLCQNGSRGDPNGGHVACTRGLLSLTEGRDRDHASRIHAAHSLVPATWESHQQAAASPPPQSSKLPFLPWQVGWLSQQAAGLSGLDPGSWGWQGDRAGRQVLTPRCFCAAVNASPAISTHQATHPETCMDLHVKQRTRGKG